MGLADLIKNKPLEETKKLCLDAYNKGSLQEVDKAVRAMYKENPEDALAILKHITEKITIKNDKELGRAKELRRFWKGIDSQSYKKDGLILKTKYKNFLLKDENNNAKECLSWFCKGKTEILFKELKDMYELEPNVCRYILKYIAQNTRNSLFLPHSKFGVANEYMDFWSKLDPSHYNKYKAKLKQDYVATISKLSKSSVQNFLTSCKVAVTKPQYVGYRDALQDRIDALTSNLKSMYSYDYYHDDDITVLLNKNDLLDRFLVIFKIKYIDLIAEILHLMKRSDENGEGSAEKCYNSLMSSIKSNFNLDFRMDGSSPRITNQLQPICLKSSLEELVDKLNNSLSVLSEFKV